jgi:hypothetical protein
MEKWWDQADFVQVIPETSYKRVPPSLLNFHSDHKDLMQYFLQNIADAKQDCPPEGVIPINNCIVHAGKYVRSSSNSWIGYSIRDSSEHEQAHSLFEERKKTSKDLHKIEIEDPSRPVVHIGKAGAGNYGHFLVEMLPRLIIIKNAHISRFTLLLPAESMKFQYLCEIVANTLGLDIDYVACARHSIYEGDIISATPLSRHNKQKSKTLVKLVSILREWQASKIEGKSSGFNIRKILVSREGDQRDFANLDELKDEWNMKDKLAVNPKDLTFASQIELFSNANCVIGGLGAGLTNLIFCSPGTRILYITPGIIDYFFWDIACLFNLDFYWLFAGPACHWSLSMSQDSYSVDKKIFRAALDLIESKDKR